MIFSNLLKSIYVYIYTYSIVNKISTGSRFCSACSVLFTYPMAVWLWYSYSTRTQGANSSDALCETMFIFAWCYPAIGQVPRRHSLSVKFWNNGGYQIARFMWPTWGPPGSCRPQMGPMLAPWTLLPGLLWRCHYLLLEQTASRLSRCRKIKSCTFISL